MKQDARLLSEYVWKNFDELSQSELFDISMTDDIPRFVLRGANFTFFPASECGEFSSTWIQYNDESSFSISTIHFKEIFNSCSEEVQKKLLWHLELFQ